MRAPAACLRIGQRMISTLTAPTIDIDPAGGAVADTKSISARRVDCEGAEHFLDAHHLSTAAPMISCEKPSSCHGAAIVSVSTVAYLLGRPGAAFQFPLDGLPRASLSDDGINTGCLCVMPVRGIVHVAGISDTRHRSGWSISQAGRASREGAVSAIPIRSFRHADVVHEDMLPRRCRMSLRVRIDQHDALGALLGIVDEFGSRPPCRARPRPGW